MLCKWACFILVEIERWSQEDESQYDIPYFQATFCLDWKYPLEKALPLSSMLPFTF